MSEPSDFLWPGEVDPICSDTSGHSPDGVNVSGLTEYYASSGVGRNVLDHLARRERNMGSTTVDRMQTTVNQGEASVSRADVMDVFRKLGELGCGSFKLGRRGKASRFEWSMGMVSVGKAAAGEISEVYPISGEDASDEELEDASHSFRLRADKVVTFELPLDLNAVEAGRLADFIKTLPLAQGLPKTWSTQALPKTWSTAGRVRDMGRYGS